MSFFKNVYKKYSNFVRSLRFRKIKQQLRNTNFSIFSSDCLGGIVYHDLKKEFTSPTINLSFSEDNYSFLNFCCDPDYYLNKKISFINNKNYPKGVIEGDSIHQSIYLSFIHYKNEDDAISCWNRRRVRVSENKVFLYLKYELDDVDIKFVNSIKNLIVITSNKTNLTRITNKSVLISKYLSKVKRNNGRLISYKGLFGGRNFDDTKLFNKISNLLKENKSI